MDEEIQSTDNRRDPIKEFYDLQTQLQETDDPEKRLEIWHKLIDKYLEVNGLDLSDPKLGSEVIVKIRKEILQYNEGDARLNADITQSYLEDLVRGRTYSLNESAKNPDVGADPVEMFNGQFVQEETDLQLAGAGVNFTFKRIYKNQAAFRGPLGFNWDHAYNLRLRVVGDVIFRSTGMLREDVYLKHPKFGQAQFSYWVPPEGLHGLIIENNATQSYVWRAPNGVRFYYRRDDPATDSRHSIDRIEDHYGNFLQFSYQDQRLVSVAVNQPDRLVRIHYDSEDRIVAIEDYVGRVWQYGYDDFGDLVAVTTPGTDRYPGGLATCYEYSSSQFSGQLQHNLTRIIDPAGQLYLENEYGAQPNLLSFNRVVRQRQGNGISLFEYANVIQSFEFDYSDAERPAHQSTMVARNGHVTRNVYNSAGKLLLREEQILQAGRLKLLRWRYRYNADGMLIGGLTPDGTITQYYYGRDHYLRKHGITDDQVVSHEQLTMRERMAFGNLLAVVKRAKRYDIATLNLSRGVWADFFPDVISGTDPDDIVTKFTYESEFQQLTSSSDPRYTQSADPDATSSPQEHIRYQETLTRYHYKNGPNDEPNFDLDQIEHPEAHLPDGTLQTGIIERFVQYDERGRLLRSMDPLGVFTEMSYFDADSEVREGYLRSQTVDAGGLALRTEYEVNEIGLTIGITLPKAQSNGVPAGHFRTTHEINNLNQVTRTTVSAPFSYQARFFYDRNGQLEREERDLQDENGDPILGGAEVKTYRYDQQFNLLAEAMGGTDPATHLVTRHRYNQADKRIHTRFPRGNQIWHTYEERLLETSTIRGACSPEASTTRVEYSGDGLVVKTIDARGNVTHLEYDAFNRLIATTDALGHVARVDYDKSGQVTFKRFFERQEDGSYRLLSRSEYEYDELGRQISERLNLFEDPLVLPTGNLAADFLDSPGPGTLVDTLHFYDKKGRLVKVVNAKGQETRFEYDALDRSIRETDALGNYTLSEYDAHSNLIRQEAHEQVIDAATGNVLREDVFSVLHEYDELDRLVATIDNMGNTIHFFYDSRGNLVKQIDPLGNVRRTEFDLYGRKTADIAERTTTGLGDSGTSLPPLITRCEYDVNSNQDAVVDAKGNRTAQVYDQLDRVVLRRYPDESEEQYRLDANDNIISHRDNNGLVRQYTYDALNRLTHLTLDPTQLAPGLSLEGATFEAYGFDGLGRMVREENDFAALEHKLDSLGRVVAETLRFHINTPDVNLAKDYLLQRRFDILGNPVQITYPSGRVIQYGLDDLNRIERITNVSKGVGYPGSDTFVDTYELLAHHFRGLRREQTRFGNGAAVAYRYDQNRRVIEIAHSAADGTNLLTLQQLYDGAGNMRLKQELQSSGTRGETYKYNALYWLTKIDEDTNPVPIDPAAFAPPDANLPRSSRNGQAQMNARLGGLADDPTNFTYRYDSLGNREEERQAGQPANLYRSNNLNQYTQVGTDSLHYDANGNLLDDGQRQYMYDVHNRLVKVREATSGRQLVHFFYDTQGRRILSAMDGQMTYFIFNGQNVIEEYRHDAVWAQYVLAYGFDSLCQIAAEGNEHWYHIDLVRSTRLLTDSMGNVAGRYRYTAFGKLLDSSPLYNPFTYMGRPLDQPIESYQFRFRQYLPQIGKFLQRDAVASANLYLFVENDPLSSTDSMGMDREKQHEFGRFGYGLGLNQSLNLDTDEVEAYLSSEQQKYQEFYNAIAENEAQIKLIADRAGFFQKILLNPPNYFLSRAAREAKWATTFGWDNPMKYMSLVASGMGFTFGLAQLQMDYLLTEVGAGLEWVDPGGKMSRDFMIWSASSPVPADDLVAAGWRGLRYVGVRSGTRLARFWIKSRTTKYDEVLETLGLEGTTDWMGNIYLNPKLNREARLLALRHERFHQRLTPRSVPLAMAKDFIRKHSNILHSMEEMAAETYAQTRTFGWRGIPKGLRYPFSGKHPDANLILWVVEAGAVYGLYRTYKLTSSWLEE